MSRRRPSCDKMGALRGESRPREARPAGRAHRLDFSSPSTRESPTLTTPRRCATGKCMAGADRKRQKKLEKSRKKRELVKKQSRKRELLYQGASLLRLAQAAPFGPAWVSTELD